VRGNRNKLHTKLSAVLCCLLLAGCYALRSSEGGGQTSFTGVRSVNAADVAVPAGYRIEPVATGLTFPTGVAFDADGVAHVVEAGYSYGEVFTTPRLLRIERDGRVAEVARGERNGPWTGLAFSNGNFFIAEGGQLQGGRILRVSRDGSITPLISGLPSHGDHHTNGPAIGPDGRIYFGQGVATNSGVVGEDNAKFGWLKRFPKFHDVPCQDITLAGENFHTAHPLEPGAKAATGAFSPFATPTQAGQIIKGRLPCSGAVMRVAPDGSGLELVAWGFRNPFGMAFAPDGQLYVTDNGYDDRGSRPVWGAADVLWRATPGAWFGWPDFAEGRPLTRDEFKPPGKEPVRFLLARHPATPPKPVAVFGVHSSSNGLDFSRSERFGHVGQAFVAQFGDQAPTTGKVLHPVGFRVVRVEVSNGRIEDFAVNRGKHNGPATKIGGGGLERPVAVRFSPDGQALYVVDFGVLLETGNSTVPQQQTGVLWRITRESGR
jgi:glucose/arabinose dehydrogenase